MPASNRSPRAARSKPTGHRYAGELAAGLAGNASKAKPARGKAKPAAKPRSV